MRDDRYWIRRALEEAEKAFLKGDVPVGAVLVRAGEVVGAGYNKVEISGNPFDHAEMVAMQEVVGGAGPRALQDCTLYVSLEPCTMCVGAAILARIPRLVFGAHEEKTGACESIFSIPNDAALEHRMVVTGGIEEERCRQIIQEFFKKRRSNKDR